MIDDYTMVWHIQPVHIDGKTVVVCARYTQFVDVLAVVADRLLTLGEANTAIDLCGEEDLNIRSMAYVEDLCSFFLGGACWLVRLDIRVD